MKPALIFLAIAWPGSVFADSWVATQALRPGTVIEASHITSAKTSVSGAIPADTNITGQEARVMIYAGRPIRPADIGPAAIVERNSIVELIFQNGALRISTDGRALGRGAAGDRIRAINLASKTTVTGFIASRGRIIVSAD